MKLLVKVIEAKYSDTPQMAVLEMTLEFLETVRKLADKGSVNFTGEDALPLATTELVSEELRAAIA